MLSLRRVWVGLAAVLAVGSGCSVMTHSEEAKAERPVGQTKQVKRVKKALDQPVELGRVAWGRDFDAALALARAEKKPVLVLFDEVPGCSTVIGYGKTVLSHPLIVEAAETLFVPVVVYNNIGGPDRTVLESFDEPTWNNPVVRIIDPNRKALSPRIAGDYTVGGLASGMVEALEAESRDVPEWLLLLAQEGRAARGGTDKALFSMYCFWSGEAGLGGIDGVVSTRTGFAGGREVVEVEYDPSVVSAAELIGKAKGIGEHFEPGGAMRHSPKDDKYRLAHSSWRHVPMTPAQASRVNALLGLRKEPSAVLSPRQRRLHAVVVKHPEAGWPVMVGVVDLVGSFEAAEEVAARLRTAAR